jgi:2-polyprenyl-6-methoxyphenol hydroxylase-like FAD-dependent oxidoreductase
MAAAVADRFQVGRVLLAGDAAKVTPPSGGFGGDTAVGDAYDLAWKLAAVLDSTAGPGLLDTYDAEWRPIAERGRGRSAAVGGRPRARVEHRGPTPADRPARIPRITRVATPQRRKMSTVDLLGRDFVYSPQPR